MLRTSGGGGDALEGWLRTSGGGGVALEGLLRTSGGSGDALEGLLRTSGGGGDALEGLLRTSGGGGDALEGLLRTNGGGCAQEGTRDRGAVLHDARIGHLRPVIRVDEVATLLSRLAAWHVAECRVARARNLTVFALLRISCK